MRRRPQNLCRYQWDDGVPRATSFYEYDFAADRFTGINGPTGPTHNVQPFVTEMLCLPDGTILFSDGSPQLYVYVPGGIPVAGGKPIIRNITSNGDASYHLTGLRLNGTAEGAVYGDVAQLDRTYRLVRLVDGAGQVIYGRTFNWSSTGVQTGDREVSTEFTINEGLRPGDYSLVVVANGIASDPVTFYGPIWVDFNWTGPQTGSFFSP